MSRENVEIVRRLYAQWARGDFSNQEPFSKDLAFEMSGWILFQSDPIKASGVDGLTAVWREVLTGWDDLHSGPIEELIEEGDQIVVINRLVARGRQSGIEIDARRGAVFTFGGGKITRLRLTGDDEALDAVGRRE